VHAESRGRYGSPRVHRELVAKGLTVSKHRVARLMRENGLRGKRRRKFRHTTDSDHALPVAPNTLARDFTADAPNEAWVTDITYIPTREGWLYLAAIIDLFSRRVVGWSMSDRITRQLTLDALTMALAARTPAVGLLHHSDRGSQYASADYRAALDAAHIECSMSRKGNCWDNAVAESFFATLKTELVHDADWCTRAEARSAIFEYLEIFYNRRRRHSSIGYVSPEEFELRYEEREMAA
jgi:putative transposase